MSTLRIDNNEMFVTEVTVRESDPYSRSAYVSFHRHYVPESVRGVNQMFMTTDELEQLGQFLLDQAAAIKASQPA